MLLGLCCGTDFIKWSPRLLQQVDMLLLLLWGMSPCAWASPHKGLRGLAALEL